MADIVRDFESARVLVERAKDSMGGENHRLPSAEELADCATVCLHASMETEEGRSIVFNVAFCAEPGVLKGSRTLSVATFDSPRPFTPAEIAKVAPALDASQSFLGVGPGETGLVIWGLINAGRSMSRYRRGESARASLGPQCMRFQVLGAGKVDLFFADHKMVEWRRGTARTDGMPVLWTPGPIRTACDRHATVGKCESALWDSFVRLILLRMHDLGHGGVLAVVSSMEEAAFTLIKYKLVEHRGLTEFSRTATAESEAWERIEREVKAGQAVPAKDRHLVANARSIGAEAERADDAAVAIGNLTAVDGIVILRSDLRVLAFGAFIRTESVAEVVRARSSLSDDVEPYDLSTHGARHHAALVAASRLPDAVVFIVSSDGEMSACMRVGDRVVVWPNIDLSTPI